MHIPNKGKMRFDMLLEIAIAIWITLTSAIAIGVLSIPLENGMSPLDPIYRVPLIIYAVVTVVGVSINVCDNTKGPSNLKIMKKMNSIIISKMDRWKDRPYICYLVMGLVTSIPIIVTYYIAIAITIGEILYKGIKKTWENIFKKI